jgi:hypothetical protein
MAIQLTNSFQKVAELTSQVTTNTKGFSRLYLKYGDRKINELTDVVYYEIRQYSYNPYGNYLGWSNSNATSWSIKNSSNTNLASGSYVQTPIYSNSGEIVRASGNFVVKHGEDGAWSDVIKFSDYILTSSLSTTIEISLPNIDRLATITNCPTSLTDEDTTITFSYSNPANFKVKVYAMVTQESANGFAYDEYLTGSPFTWEWLSSDKNKEILYNVVRNSPNATVSLRLQTYNNNDELLGITAVSIPFTLVNAEPFVELETKETNEKVKNVVGSELIAVNYVSQLKATATFTGSKGSTLKKININGVISNTSPFETLINVENEDASTIFGVVASVEDSRTLTDGAEQIYQLVDYRPISINSYKFKRENPTSDQIYLNAEITYWGVSVNNVANNVVVSYSTDGETYITIPSSSYTINSSDNTIKINNYKVPTKLNYQNQGKYYLKVSDNFTEDIENDIVTKGIPVTEKGKDVFQVNGRLIVADENRQNPVDILKDIWKIVYPIGTFYETDNTSFNPNVSWGGTWVLEEDGTTLVSKSSVTGSKFNADIGTIVGFETHTLTLSEMPSSPYNPGVQWAGTSGYANSNGAWGTGYVFNRDDILGLTTKNQPHNNVQPSKIVNRWHRTA